MVGILILHCRLLFMPPELAVLIPAWDERANLESLLPSLWEVIAKLGAASEVIVIDGGSRDGTQDIGEAFGVRVIGQKEMGYGGALLTGFAATGAPYIVTMDADQSHRPVFIEELWRRKDEAEVVIASRYVPGGKAEMSRFRLVLSGMLNRT